MFRSATFQLTTWYLGILVAISLLFSVIIYSVSLSEVSTRLGFIRTSFEISQPRYETIRDMQLREAEASLVLSLAITNLAIWIAGGFGSYYLARHTLRPIEEAHEAQSRFTSDASHELRTPLASMKTELEVALRDPKLSIEEARELLVSNLEEVNKLTSLSQMLLQLSRLEHTKLKPEKVALQPAARAVIKRFDKTGKRVQLEGKPYRIMAHPTSIEELLTILIDNAVKYSPKNSLVTIRLISDKRHMAGFEVVNEGKGIPEKDLPHIFDRFYRVDASRTGGEKKGYGLGLSLAKKIVQLHDGELSVSSSSELTIFRVLLPTLSKVQAKNQQSHLHS
jgi:two-component system sensor histidine kinase CiaH